MSPEFREECPSREGKLSWALVPTRTLAGWRGGGLGRGGRGNGVLPVRAPFSHPPNRPGVETHKASLWGARGRRAAGGRSVRRGGEARSPKLAQPVPLSCRSGRVRSPPRVQNFAILRTGGIEDPQLPSAALDAGLRLWLLRYRFLLRPGIAPPPSASPACPGQGTPSCAFGYFWARM